MSVLGAFLGATAISSAVGLGSNIAANKANKELAKYQYQKDLEMWNRQNEYNHPTQQMERLKQAGLNPNLVYGTGAVGNTASAMPNYPQVKKQPYTKLADDVKGGILGAYQAKNMESMNQNLDSQNEVLQSQTLVNNEKAVHQGIINKKEALDLTLKEQTLGDSIKGVSLDTSLKTIQLEQAQKNLQTIDLQQESISLANNLAKENITMTAFQRANLAAITSLTLAKIPYQEKVTMLMEKYGIREGDSLIYRILAGASEKIGFSLDNLKDINIQKKFNETLGQPFNLLGRFVGKKLYSVTD